MIDISKRGGHVRGCQGRQFKCGTCVTESSVRAAECGTVKFRQRKVIHLLYLKPKHIIYLLIL